MTKEQQTHIEAIMWAKIRRINQYDKYLMDMPDQIARAEEEGETERAEYLQAVWERRRLYRDERLHELHGMYEIIEALGYAHRVTVDDDGNNVCLKITKAE